MRVEKHRAARMRLDSPIMLVCLDGWVDAGGVLERTTRALLDSPSVLLAEFDADEGGSEAVNYEYEPDEEEILADLLPRNIATQIFRGLLENGASEQGSRMTAMDNATRNAGEMIDKLTIQYNRSRQAAMTKELIEIISGAEAL